MEQNVYTKKSSNIMIFIIDYILVITFFIVQLYVYAKEDLIKIGQLLKSQQMPILSIIFLILVLLLIIMSISLFILSRILYFIYAKILKCSIEFIIFNRIFLIFTTFSTIGSIINSFFSGLINIFILTLLNPIFLLGVFWIYKSCISKLNLSNKKSYLMAILMYISNSILILLGGILN